MAELAQTVDRELAQASKTAAAVAALEFVREGMVVGLGSGSTAEIFVERLGERVREGGLSVRAVATSEQTAHMARIAGVPMIPIEHADRIDLAVDGADEVDPRLDLIKGGGGRHLREKIIAAAADQFIVIVDQSKLVEELGGFPLPVEVDPFGFTITAKKVFDAIRAAGGTAPEITVRCTRGDVPFKTDGGHYILDCACGMIPNAGELGARLRDIPGVVEHGLFIAMADVVIIGRPNAVEIVER